MITTVTRSGEKTDRNIFFQLRDVRVSDHFHLLFHCEVEEQVVEIEQCRTNLGKLLRVAVKMLVTRWQQAAEIILNQIQRAHILKRGCCGGNG